MGYYRMHLALSVQCIDGEAVYIDTEGSLMKSRVIEMASCRLEKSVQEWCSHIHYYRVHDYQELHEVVKQLPLVLKEFPKVSSYAVVIAVVSYVSSCSYISAATSQQPAPPSSEKDLIQFY